MECAGRTSPTRAPERVVVPGDLVVHLDATVIRPGRGRLVVLDPEPCEACGVVVDDQVELRRQVRVPANPLLGLGIHDGHEEAPRLVQDRVYVFVVRRVEILEDELASLLRPLTLDGADREVIRTRVVQEADVILDHAVPEISELTERLPLLENRAAVET
jgi:hypothetical protein